MVLVCRETYVWYVREYGRVDILCQYFCVTRVLKCLSGTYVSHEGIITVDYEMCRYVPRYRFITPRMNSMRICACFTALPVVSVLPSGRHERVTSVLKETYHFFYSEGPTVQIANDLTVNRRRNRTRRDVTTKPQMPHQGGCHSPC